MTPDISDTEIDNVIEIEEVQEFTQGMNPFQP